jgi:hypothetical protein
VTIGNLHIEADPRGKISDSPGEEQLTTTHDRIVRKAVLTYSKRNRRRKADRILNFIQCNGVKDVLFIGTTGDEWSHDPTKANLGIVEKLIAEHCVVKMSINLYPAKSPAYPFMVADARDMPFPDDYVDFALANAIIEHVGQEPQQRRMVEEMTRVARSWVITTPNKWFPVESHTAALFVHWWPSWRAKHGDEFTRLLSRRQFRKLLPADAKVTGWWFSPTFTATHAR